MLKVQSDGKDVMIFLIQIVLNKKTQKNAHQMLGQGLKI